MLENEGGTSTSQETSAETPNDQPSPDGSCPTKEENSEDVDNDDISFPEEELRKLEEMINRYEYVWLDLCDVLRTSTIIISFGSRKQ